MPQGKGTYGKQVGRPKKKKKAPSSNSTFLEIMDCYYSTGGQATCDDPECVGSDCENPT